MPDESNLIDESTVLSNVEEMLEGFEWRGSVGNYSDGSSSAGFGGTGAKGRKADEIEKRLIGELKALEAVSLGSGSVWTTRNADPGSIRLPSMLSWSRTIA